MKLRIVGDGVNIWVLNAMTNEPIEGIEKVKVVIDTTRATAKAAIEINAPFDFNNLLVEDLSGREIEVLRHIANGYTNRQIGDALNISTRTVESHRANIMDKLGLHSRFELVKYARENGYAD